MQSDYRKLPVEMKHLYAIHAILELIETLRGENGCPWDKEQTPKTMIAYLEGEVKELAEAIQDGDAEHIREELGDVLFQVLFIAILYKEQGKFDIESMATLNVEKMTRRHPHVFGDSTVKNADDVRELWKQIKQEEQNKKRPNSSEAIKRPV